MQDKGIRYSAILLIIIYTNEGWVWSAINHTPAYARQERLQITLFSCFFVSHFCFQDETIVFFVKDLVITADLCV